MNQTTSLLSPPVRPAVSRADLRAGCSYFDPAFGCPITVTTPSLRPDLWAQFLHGAKSSYTRHGVESALEYDKIEDGSTTSLFFAALDPAGRVMGGVRAQGPYASADQTHAHIEWNGHEDGQNRLDAMVSDRIADGVVEIKSGWVAPNAPRGRDLAYLIGHASSLGSALLGARYALATAAEHVLRTWTRTGAVPVRHIDAIPYPTDAYRTQVIWWDRDTLEQKAEPEHYGRVVDALEALLFRSGPFALHRTDEDEAVAS